MVRRSVASGGSRVVSATEAARNFGSIVARVREDRAVYVVERSGTPVARIGPVEERGFTGGDFVKMARSGAARVAGAEYLRAVEEGIALLNRSEVPESPWEP